MAGLVSSLGAPDFGAGFADALTGGLLAGLEGARAFDATAAALPGAGRAGRVFGFGVLVIVFEGESPSVHCRIREFLATFDQNSPDFVDPNHHAL
jgi:hypothetical protein